MTVRLKNAVVCILGRGAIGRELARKLKGIDARPIAVSRTLEPDAIVEQVFPRERLHEALAMADAVAICTGGDADSRHLIGAAEFAAMKPGAFIVNVARGSIIDETALIAALAEGRLAGAGLDVAETEPMARRQSALGHAERDRLAACRGAGFDRLSATAQAVRREPRALPRRQAAAQRMQNPSASVSPGNRKIQ